MPATIVTRKAKSALEDYEKSARKFLSLMRLALTSKIYFVQRCAPVEQ
jgi:hypothetical protein